MVHITIDDVTPRIQYTPLSGQVTFTIPFPWFDDADIYIYFDDNDTAESSGYTLSGVGDSAGGDVTFSTAPFVSGVGLVTIIRDTSIKRLTDFSSSGQWTAKNVNDELDKIVTMAQELEVRYARALHFKITDTTSAEPHVPLLDDRKGKVLGFDPVTGAPVASTETLADIEGSITASAASAAAAAAAQTAAEAAQTAAEAAQTGAETAEANAQTAQAAAEAAALGWDTVTVLNNAGSPYTLTHNDARTYYLIDSSAGAVTVNFPAIGTTEGTFYAFEVTDASNTITLAGPDYINGVNGDYTDLDTVGQVIHIISDDNTPDNWLATIVSQVPAASETVAGKIEIATQSEVNAGTDTSRAVTPSTLANFTGLQTIARNRIINGVAPFINQRGAQTGMSNGDYFVDRWQYVAGGTPTAVVDGDVTSSGGEDWVEVDVTTADAALAAGDVYYVSQKVEANNIVDFYLGTASAATVTLSFKHAHTKTGTYCVAFRNSAANRAYVAEYTQSVADTEESSTVTLTLDTSGTWATGTGVGLSVGFCMGSGSTFQTTADSWQAGNYLATANQVNALDNTSNFFRIRDVQLELGSVATAPVFEKYGDLQGCQRYYVNQSSAEYCTGGVYAASARLSRPHTYPVTMRAAPTVATTTGSSGGVGTVTITGNSAAGFTSYAAATGANTAAFYDITYTADAEL